jgi:hypothetical protein
MFKCETELGFRAAVTADDLGARIEDVTLDLVELPAGEKAFLSLQLPPGCIRMMNRDVTDLYDREGRDEGDGAVKREEGSRAETIQIAP